MNTVLFVLAMFAVVIATSEGKRVEYCHRPDRGCPKGTIAEPKVKSLQECIKACKSNSKCKSIYYGPGQCHLKNYVCKWSEMHDNIGYNDYVIRMGKGETCGMYQDPRFCKGEYSQYCHRPDSGCHPLTLAGPKVKNLQGCINACKSNSKCKSIYYGPGYCHLKGSLCKLSELRHYVGYSDYIIRMGKGETCSSKYQDKSLSQYCHRPDIGCPKGTITSPKVKNLKECIKACKSNSKCKSIYYGLGHCHVKDYVCKWSELRATPGYSDYVIRMGKGETCGTYENWRLCKGKGQFSEYCHRPDSGCPRTNIAQPKVKNLQECVQACKSNSKCKSIYYGPKHCHLKSYVCKYSELRRYPGHSDYVIRLGKGETCEYETPASPCD